MQKDRRGELSIKTGCSSKHAYGNLEEITFYDILSRLRVDLPSGNNKAEEAFNRVIDAINSVVQFDVSDYVAKCIYIDAVY